MYLSITIANEHWRNTNQYSVFVTDDTGHGKAIMAIYNNNDGRPTPQNGTKATLVVTPPSIPTQWMPKITKHVELNTVVES